MSDKVFVVHGRNARIRIAMFDFLRAIGLRPLEWGQSVDLTGKGSPYIGEVLDAAFAEVRAVVVLLTGDDVAVLRSEFRTADDPDYEIEPTPQARPNVIFEAGMAFGTHPERTVIVEIGNVRPFSDVVGRNVVRLTNSTQSRQMLAQRLKNAGCSVDLSGTDWQMVGDFNPAAGLARTDEFAVLAEEVHPDASTRGKKYLETSIPDKTIYDEVLVCLAMWWEKWQDSMRTEDIAIHLKDTFNVSPTRAEALAEGALTILVRRKYVHSERLLVGSTKNLISCYAITKRGEAYLADNTIYTMYRSPLWDA